MKYLTAYFFIIIFGFHLSFAQNPTTIQVYGINMDTIAAMVKKHPKYFYALQRKFLKAPGKMEQDEMILMYYGSAFLKNFDPKKEDAAVEKIAGILGELDFETAIREANSLLPVYPVNSRLNMLLGYAYKKLGMKDKSAYYYKRYADLIRIPLYSGNGKNFDTAFIIRIISDEYLVLNQKDLELVQQELRYHRQMPYDVLLIKPRSKNNERMKVLPKEKYYFNIYLPFFVGEHHTYKELQEKAKRKYKMPVESSEK
jgi:hypothetical protein